MKKIFLFMVTTLLSLSSYSQCNCDFTISLNASEWFFDGVKKGVKPGQTICFESGTRTGFQLRNIKGTKEKPVIITNKCDGSVFLNAPSNWGNVLSVEGCSNIVIHGSSNPAVKYGIKLSGGQAGLNLQKLTTNFEVHNIEVANVGCSGILAKTDPTCDSKTWRGNFTLKNSSIHHCKVYNVGCEGFYVGNSHFDTYVTKTCGLTSKKIYEHEIDSIEIAYNEVTSTDLDGIQVGSSKHALIHHNYINGTGIDKELWHENGMQIGSGTEYSYVFNNWIENSGSYSIIDGGGGTQFFNNVLLGARDGAFCFVKDVTKNNAQKMYHNTIVQPGKHVLTVGVETSDSLQFINNIVVVQDQFVKYNYQPRNLLSVGRNVITKDENEVKFIDPGVKDFRLQYGSPAMDFGFPLIGLDFSNRQRDKTADAGAYEAKCVCTCE